MDQDDMTLVRLLPVPVEGSSRGMTPSETCATMSAGQYGRYHLAPRGLVGSLTREKRLGLNPFWERVFPAHAGLIRGSWPLRHSHSCVPRSRGADPLQAFKTVTNRMCSPPSRG